MWQTSQSRVRRRVRLPNAGRGGVPRVVKPCAGAAALAMLGLAALPAPAAAQAQQNADVLSHGLSYMTAFGTHNYPVVSLLYGVIIISLAVCAIIGILVLSGSLLRRARTIDNSMESVPLERGGNGLAFIYVGVGISFLVLTATVVWNYVVLADIAGTPADTAATIHVIGHQWWWEVRYDSKDPSRTFTTANEIHIPVGKPVKVVLTTADVIHSFWVPALSGKMDTIPGQHNVTWIEADKAGIYRGQCTEYCGQQHAHMGFFVTAQPPDQFKEWWDHQLTGPETVRSGVPSDQAGRGEAVFMKNCAVCHAVRGTMADGKVGPNLSHLMQRKTIGAGTLPNTIGNLSGWISNPQQIKPGNFMPTLTLSAIDLNNLRAFLKTLQ